MTTISFNKNPLPNKTVEITKRIPLNATIKYGNVADLPGHEERSAIIVSVDSGEIFAGTGTTGPLKKIGDVSVLPTTDDFPEIGVLEKIYISKETNASYFFDGEAYQPLAGGSGSGTPVNSTRINEYPSAAEFPAEGLTKSLYIDLASNSVYRFDIIGSRYIKLTSGPVDMSAYRLRTEKIAEGDLSAALAAKVNPDLSGYAKSADVRAKGDKIAEADLSAALVTKINSATAGGITSINGKTGSAVTIGITDINGLQSELTDKADVFLLDNKVEKVAGKGLSTNDFSDMEKTKLAGLVNYTHPTTHAATMITTDTNNRFVSDADKALWNAKADVTNVYTKVETDNRIEAIINAAPAALDTLAELADSLGNDANFASTVTASLSTKVEKVAGKALSTNDFTNAEQTKLAGLSNYTHPASHPATMITEDSTHKFVTDVEKNAWNAKQVALEFIPEDTSKKGQVNGYAPLGSDGKVPSTYLPESSGGGNEKNLMTYEAIGSTGGDCIITATGAGVTFSKNINAAEITPPAGVKILSARVRFTGAEISTSANCSISFDGSLSPNDYVNIVPPLFQVYNDVTSGRAMRTCASNLNINSHTMQFTGLLQSTGVLIKLNY